MSVDTIKVLIAAALLLHGLGHSGAIGALIFLGFGQDGGSWRPAQSWLFPSLASPAATAVAGAFWGLSTIGFVAAAMSFWGIFVPGDTWRQLAVTSAIVSTIGILLFAGTWPPFNTLAALVVNAAVLVTQLWLSWPPSGMFGK